MDTVQQIIVYSKACNLRRIRKTAKSDYYYVIQQAMRNAHKLLKIPVRTSRLFQYAQLTYHKLPPVDGNRRRED